jgi:hypothetical protein
VDKFFKDSYCDLLRRQKPSHIMRGNTCAELVAAGTTRAVIAAMALSTAIRHRRAVRSPSMSGKSGKQPGKILLRATGAGDRRLSLIRCLAIHLNLASALLTAIFVYRHSKNP